MEDRGLQHERTELGWRRTGLTAAALTVGFVRVHIDELDAVAAVSVALAGAIVLVILAVVMRLPTRRDGRIPAAITALVAAIAAAQLAAVAFD